MLDKSKYLHMGKIIVLNLYISVGSFSRKSTSLFKAMMRKTMTETS